jgi:hypothetical protein
MYFNVLRVYSILFIGCWLELVAQSPSFGIDSIKYPLFKVQTLLYSIYLKLFSILEFLEFWGFGIYNL